ncbi:hypothetical protein BC936DRAFT_142707 [Jimgerdemannia flammicorona]|uniref:Uncharacterized protein n=1 Tax=Jimgerdemannia flammicorona TaxID=994334 RepID=A0A432ZZY3_9FUNG|nr:hypothetical protein BC936DRAFT_142707 [Jimgerdemannia flammicorona]
MQCLNPPLNRKPSKGFAWQCALCSRREPASSPAPDQKSGSGSLSAPQSPNSSSTTPSRHATGSSRATQPPPVLNGRHRSRATSRSSTPSEEATIVVEDKLRIIEEGGRLGIVDRIDRDDMGGDLMLNSFENTDESDGSSQNHMWPFRYFGIHTNVNDILGRCYIFFHNRSCYVNARRHALCSPFVIVNICQTTMTGYIHEHEAELAASTRPTSPTGYRTASPLLMTKPGRRARVWLLRKYRSQHPVGAAAARRRWKGEEGLRGRQN